MAKIKEQELIARVVYLEQEFAKLHTLVENKKLEKHIYSIAETAQILGITRQGVYLMVARGELETVKLGSLKIKGDSLRQKLGVE